MPLLAEAQSDDITPVLSPTAAATRDTRVASVDPRAAAGQDAVVPRAPVIADASAGQRVVPAPSEARDPSGSGLVIKPDQRAGAGDQRTATRSGDCVQFQYEDQGSSASDQKILNWRANPNSTSDLTKNWKARHADLMQQDIQGGSYKAQFGDDLDGVIVRYMRGHGQSMDHFKEKKAEVLRLNQDHYKTLPLNTDYLGTGWKLKLEDCGAPPPAPAPIDPPRQSERVEPRQPRVAQEEPAPEPEVAVRPRAPIVQDAPPPQVVERDCRTDGFGCDGGRLQATNNYGNVIINGVPMGAGTGEVMIDGRMRHHNPGSRVWEEMGRYGGPVIGEVMPRMPRLTEYIPGGQFIPGLNGGDYMRRESLRDEYMRREYMREAYMRREMQEGNQFYGPGMERSRPFVVQNDWERRRQWEWARRQQQSALYGRGTNVALNLNLGGTQGYDYGDGY